MITSLLFFFSGLAGLLYQIVWLRLAFGHFGIITPVLSTVVSVFMLGLGLGSWSAGRWVARRPTLSAEAWLRYYGLIELGIGLCALAVPVLFRIGEQFLLRLGEMSSGGYLAGSGVAIVLALLPGCWLMGMTYPVMMAYARGRWQDSSSSFSLLYRANILGALTGTVLTAVFFIEWLGFRATNGIGVAANFLNALICFAWPASSKTRTKKTGPADTPAGAPSRGSRALLYPIFVTGLVSMAFEVMWARSFTSILGTTIYAFSTVLMVYLAATWMGASLYRRDLARGKAWPFPHVYTALAFSAFLPIFFISRHLHAGICAIIAVLIPFCFALGYATPQMIDRYSGGDSDAAGFAYMVNIAGCVLGPLIACYGILPFFGTKAGMLMTTVLLFTLRVPFDQNQRARRQTFSIGLAGLALVFLGMQFRINPEEECPYPVGAQIRRDHVATVVACGQGFDRWLLVNGIGLTTLTPLTKAMAHIPVWCHTGKPKKALVICFGMGTTYRSLLSWGLQTTAVELVPSVRDSFGYYFEDADAVLRNPLGRVIIDDGRRFLMRTPETFDIVTLDPPPPVEAAGSGLLYSTEFYDLVKRRMNPNGVLQQWWPGGERKILASVAESLRQSFPYVRVYKGLGGVGYHFLASQQELGRPSVAECIRRLTPGARQDLLEWNAGWTLPPLVKPFFEHEVPLQALLDPAHAVALTDDHPYNEYYLCRRWLDRRKGRYVIAY